MSPELRGRDTVMEWLSEHRKQSPYPLRHHATNVYRTGTDGDDHPRSVLPLRQPDRELRAVRGVQRRR